jgi:Uma2 family endonuclease
VAVSLRKPIEFISIKDYLDGEKESPTRHEYVDGHVFAMAGASDRHNRIAINFTSRLNDRLSDGPCAVFMSDMKVMVDASTYYYPDVVVACDPPGTDRYTRRQPITIIEIISHTTERTDRFEKLPAYKRISGLKECVLIAQDQIFVEIHRSIDGQWGTEILTKPEDELQLDSVGRTVTLAEIYHNADIDTSVQV